MAKKTDEQRKADSQLDEAVAAVVAAYALMPDNAIPTNFVLCGEGMLFDTDDTDDFSEYSYQAFRHGSMATSTALGIVTLAADDLRQGREDINPDE
jgi:hypothetical protein